MSGGLVTAAFTADWGDVSPVYADQRVIYLDEATPVVGGLYASALYARAARGLAEHASRFRLRGAIGEMGSARGGRRGRRQPPAVAAATGVLPPARPVASPKGWTPPDDADMFALGGNALAVLYGIADGRAGGAASWTSPRSAAASTACPRSAACCCRRIPPASSSHPILREPFTYQNGGQWDWWAGRFVLAEFERGHAVRAMEHLRALAARAVAAGGLHEWSTRDGQGRGSPRYAGSAAALGTAVLQGLFGLDLGKSGLALHVRLGARSGEVRAHEPATGTTVAYRQAYDARARVLDAVVRKQRAGNRPPRDPAAAGSHADLVAGRRPTPPAARGADGRRGPLRGGADGLEAARARAGAALIGIAAAALAMALPFGAGERITMRVTYARLTAGRATMSVEAADHGGRPVLRFVQEVKSEGVFAWLFRYRVDNRLAAVWDPATGCSYGIEKNLRQGRFVRDQRVRIDPVARPRGDRGSQVAGGRLRRAALRPRRVVRLLRGARPRRAADGQLAVRVYDSGRLYDLVFRVIGREVLDLPPPLGRRVRTSIVEPVVPRGSGLFAQEGDLRVWVTEDARRIPVRARTRVAVGSVSARPGELRAGSGHGITFRCRETSSS